MHKTDALRVYETKFQKLRIGRPYDGGYVVCLIRINYDHFLSGGISDDSSFEHGVLSYGMAVFCEAYDPNSDGGPNMHDRMHFHREPVGYEGLRDARNALVKLDIERAEWEWLPGCPYLDHVAQLVIELHSPHHECWNWAALARLADTHTLVHAHANNWDGIVDIDGVKVPGTIETTWVRRDIEPSRVPSTAAIPGPLDMANDHTKPDHVIDWEPFVHLNLGI